MLYIYFLCRVYSLDQSFHLCDEKEGGADLHPRRPGKKTKTKLMDTKNANANKNNSSNSLRSALPDEAIDIPMTVKTK